jgi:hypothetical protein
MPRRFVRIAGILIPLKEDEHSSVHRYQIASATKLKEIIKKYPRFSVQSYLSEQIKKEIGPDSVIIHISQESLTERGKFPRMYEMTVVYRVRRKARKVI